MQLEGLQFSRSSVQSAKIAILMCEMARECEFVEKPCVLASTGANTPGTMFQRLGKSRQGIAPKAFPTRGDVHAQFDHHSIRGPGA
jgi:hypothetical protein